MENLEQGRHCLQRFESICVPYGTVGVLFTTSLLSQFFLFTMLNMFHDESIAWNLECFSLLYMDKNRFVCLCGLYSLEITVCLSLSCLSCYFQGFSCYSLAISLWLQGTAGF